MMNNFFGQTGFPNSGYAYQFTNPAMKKPVGTNPLTDEDVKFLAQKAPSFSLSVSREESLQAICTHRVGGEDRLRQNQDGSYTCMICGATFRMADLSQDAVNTTVDGVVDLLETTKVMYRDIPDAVCKAFFQMIPFLKKTKQMYKIANDHFGQYGAAINSNQFGGGNAAVLLAGLMGGGFGGYTQPGAASYGGWPGAMNMGQTMDPAQQAQAQAAQGQAAQPNANNVNFFDAESPIAGSAAPNASASDVVDNKQYTL